MKFPFYKVASAALDKAITLLAKNSVTLVDDSAVVTVEGFTADHLINIEPNGRLICDCKGFKEYELCSHVVAVAMVLENDENVGVQQ